MRILFIGDVMGRAGRDALAKHLPDVKNQLKPDVVIVNGENAAHGVGINEKICQDFFTLGVDVVTTGNHVWDQREVIPYIAREPRLLRPHNYPETLPGSGVYKHTTKSGKVIVVINLMTRLFMDPLDDPFKMADQFVTQYQLGVTAHAIFLDFHGEATSEKMAMAHYLDGRITAVIGTHTHLPSADCQIFDGGTAFQSDAGMTGDYNSVIGMKIDAPVQRFTRKFSIEKLSPAEGDGTMCGTFIVTDEKGRAQRIAPVRVGPRLENTIPNF